MQVDAIRQTEKDIQDSILEWLQYHPNTFVWRQNAGAMSGNYSSKKEDHKVNRWFIRFQSVKGIADIMGIWRTRPIAIEVKKPKGEPLKIDQEQFLQRFAECGGIAIVAQSLAEVQAVLGDIAKSDDLRSAGVYSKSVGVKVESEGTTRKTVGLPLALKRQYRQRGVRI